MNHDFVIIHSRNSWYWAGRMRWTEDLSKAKVYPTRRGVERVCINLNRKYGTLYGNPTVQYMTLEDLKAQDN